MSPPASQLPQPPSATRRWLNALLALTVTVPIGLAPLLGNLDIPGFRALLSLYPEGLRDTALPIATLAMSLVAISVQFFANDSFSGRRLRRVFVPLVLALFAMLLALAWFHSQHVVQIHVGGLDGSEESYVVADVRTPTCSCPASEGDGLCIMNIGMNPAQLPTCWPERDLRRNAFVLQLLYVLLMAGTGALVGLLVMQRTRRKASPRRR